MCLGHWNKHQKTLGNWQLKYNSGCAEHIHSAELNSSGAKSQRGRVRCIKQVPLALTFSSGASFPFFFHCKRGGKTFFLTAACSGKQFKSRHGDRLKQGAHTCVKRAWLYVNSPVAWRGTADLQLSFLPSSSCGIPLFAFYELWLNLTPFLTFWVTVPVKTRALNTPLMRFVTTSRPRYDPRQPLQDCLIMP